ncbi:MAG: Shikimate dehydrogenase substrate binding domain [Actinomycetota bacterium]
MTFKAAVLGSPVKHSLSPLIHNHAYKVLGLSIRYHHSSTIMLIRFLALMAIMQRSR